MKLDNPLFFVYFCSQKWSVMAGAINSVFALYNLNKLPLGQTETDSNVTKPVLAKQEI
jgi:hypothetical protein